MQFLAKYKYLIVACVTIGLAFILSILPISGYSTSRMVPIPKELLASNNKISIKNLALFDSSSNNGGFYLTNALNTLDLDLIWNGSIPLVSQDYETITNVILAATAVNMTTLNRYETFSFNNVVGIRTPEKGYQQGLIYSNGDVVSGVGGGICIVSTILYNAALETGLKIIERHPHSGPVSYAEPGRDAAVAYGYLDLRFKNDSEGPILIRSAVQNNELVVSLYGHIKPGRTIKVAAKDYRELPYAIEEIEDAAVPEGQVIVDQKARPGYEVTIVRTFYQDGKPVREEVISHDVIPAQDKIVRVPFVPLAIPEDLPTLPGLPSMEMLKSVPLEQPLSKENGLEAPKSSEPVSGTIKVPDESKSTQPSPKQGIGGTSTTPQPALEPSSLPASDDGQNRPTRDLTSSTDSE